MTVRLADPAALAQIGVVVLDGQIELEALRLYGLPEAAPACSAAPLAGQRGRPAATGRANLYPAKQRPEQKINAAVALMMAVGRAMVLPAARFEQAEP